MLSSQNVAIVKIPFRSRVMGFIVFLPWEWGFSTGNSGTEPSMLHYKQTISGEEILSNLRKVLSGVP